MRAPLAGGRKQVRTFAINASDSGVAFERSGTEHDTARPFQMEVLPPSLISEWPEGISRLRKTVLSVGGNVKQLQNVRHAGTCHSRAAEAAKVAAWLQGPRPAPVHFLSQKEVQKLG